MLQKEIRLVAHVPRWSIVKVLRNQSLAEHQYFTAIIAWRIIEDCGLDFTPEEKALTWKESMTHDLEEVVSGDLPGPVNRCVKANGKSTWKHWLQDRTREFFPWFIEEAAPKIKNLVKVADLMEAIGYLSEETELGNRYVQPHIIYLSNLLQQALEPMPDSVAQWCADTINDMLRVPRVLCFDPAQLQPAQQSAQQSAQADPKEDNGTQEFTPFPPPKGSWHRYDGWRLDMFKKPGCRPLLHGEVAQIGDVYHAPTRGTSPMPETARPGTPFQIETPGRVADENSWWIITTRPLP